MEHFISEASFWYSIVIGLSFTYVILGVPVSNIVASLKGIDLKDIGSGNAGATNLARAVGKGWGFLALILDGLKGPIAIFGVVPLITELSRFSPVETEIYTACVAAVLILGNIFPPLFGFYGGKAVATSLGIVLALSWQSGLVGLAGFIFILIVFGYVSVGSILGTGAAFLYTTLAEFSAFIIVLYAAIFAIIIVTHLKNIQRIKNGTERKFLKKTLLDLLKRKPVT